MSRRAMPLDSLTTLTALCLLGSALATSGCQACESRAEPEGEPPGLPERSTSQQQTEQALAAPSPPDPGHPPGHPPAMNPPQPSPGSPPPGMAPQGGPAPGAASEVSQGEVEKFSVCHMKLNTLQESLQQRAQAGEPPASLQQELQQKAVGILSGCGLSPQRYDEIARLAGRDAALRQRVEQALSRQAEG